MAAIVFDSAYIVEHLAVFKYDLYAFDCDCLFVYCTYMYW